MSTLLAVDRIPYRLLAGWVAFVRAGAVWLLLCLPVVTAPAATVVLLRTVTQILAGAATPSLSESWRLLRSHLLVSLRLSALLLIGTAVCAGALLGPRPAGIWGMVLPFVVVPVAVTWALVSPWAVPVLEQRSDMRALDALRAAYVRAMRRPDLAAGCGLGTAALLAVGVLLPAAVWIPYWLTVPALWAALVTWTSRRAATPVGGPNPLGRSRGGDTR
jgi:hypothetical protein